MSSAFRVLLIITFSSCFSALRFIKHPESDLNCVQRIKRNGYPVEEHTIVTKDNYILTTYRIPYGINSTNKTNRSPVMILHGMGSSAELLIALGKHKALPYYLADRGFDVWLPNLRGAKKSQKHKYYDLDTDPRYFKFSFHEVAIYDVAENIDYAVKITNQKVFVIGHSQGNTLYFILTSMKPEYSEKVKMSVVHAPCIDFKYYDDPITYFLLNFVDVYRVVFDLFNVHEFLPGTELFGNVAKFICSERTYFIKHCVNAMSIIGTFKSTHLDEDLVPLVTSSFPSRISTGQLFHYMQAAKSARFAQYDYGQRKNLKKYGQKIPPLYNLNNSVAPVAIFYAEKDRLTTVRGALDTADALPNVVYNKRVPDDNFNHIDFLFARDADVLVYEPTFRLLKDFDDGKIKDNWKIAKPQDKRTIA